MSKNQTRYITVTLTDDEHAALLAWARDSGLSPARITHDVITGALDERGKED